MAGTVTPKTQSRLDKTQAVLTAAGLTVQTVCLPGEAQRLLPELAKAQRPALMVMGAYGRSRLRQMVLGSTSTTL